MYDKTFKELNSDYDNPKLMLIELTKAGKILFSDKLQE